MKKIISIALMLLPILTYADDEYMTGNKLLRQLESTNSGERLFAVGYISGSIDAITASKMLLSAKPVACVSDGVTYTQLSDIIQNYLKKEPKERHIGAPILIITAIQEAYPCTEK